MSDDRNNDKNALSPVVSIFTDIFGLSRALALLVVAFIGTILCLGIFWFIYSAPPHTITITSGPPGSSFASSAEKYAKILAANGVRLKILPSEGSLQNLERLEDPRLKVDIGFVQGGLATTNAAGSRLVSLGSISYEPLLIFYRSATPIRFLSDFDGKRLAVGSAGSGTHLLALTLLQTNGISLTGSTKFFEFEADAAAQALLAGAVDAVFLTSDSASVQTMRTLLRAPGVQLFNFEQADAYSRKFAYLSKMKLPEGSIDFGKNMPSQDVWLVGPTVELVVRPNLHPALSDLLLEAARQVHGNASLLQNRGEFPAPIEHEFKISPDATRYYKSGKSFFYRSLPFWIASLVNRVLVVFVPMALVLIPGVRLIPAFYKWRIRLRIQRWYRSLLWLERDLFRGLTPEKHAALVRRLDEIEKAVKQMKVPASFADQFYSLRQHIDYVRERLVNRS
jgi:TRAP-type uncharacterized transport system substrate-binding protein